ncbi:MAG: LCP family protein [Candidatus Moranbacteria bacterium]|nr:LCP family protein [Candidatus Moranbacteria bacterium]
MDSFRKSVPPKSISPQKYQAEQPLRFSSSSDTFTFPPRKPQSTHLWRKIFLTLSGIFLLVVLGITLFFLSKGVSLGHNIQLQNNPRASFLSDIKRLAFSFVGTKRPPLRGEEKGRINILLLGRAGEHYPGKNLTDTVMIMSIDTINKKVALLSFPRDLYVPIPDTGLSTRINSLYQYGLSQKQDAGPLRSSIETITGQTIDYFFILDFDGFEKMVDVLHGISVDVVRDFSDPRYPGKNYSYETFEIKKGWQTLDGATALKYVRERHNDPEGDFGRAKRQQQVIQAIKDKAFSLETFLNVFAVNDLLDTLGENVRTDMPLDDMAAFLQLTKSLDTENVTSIIVDAWKKNSLLSVSHVQVGPIAAFILVPRVGNWSEVRDLSENIFRLDELAARQNHITNEKSTLTILSLPKDTTVAQRMKRLATEGMGFLEVSLVSMKPLENRPDESMIMDRNGLQKPFSLDELIKKFSLKKTDAFSFSLPPKITSDFVVVIGSDLADMLSFEEDTSGVTADDTAFPEVLPPQPRR